MVVEYVHVTGTGKGFRLEDVSFSLESGYVMGVVGKNGAGKSTLLRYMVEEKKQYTGQILLDGKELHEEWVASMRKIGYVSEDRRFFSRISAYDNAKLLSLYYPAFDWIKFEEQMKRMNVSSKKIIGKMSRGERIKFQMAFAMAYSPKLYLLDEATAGMDPIFVREFYRIVRECMEGENVSAILVTHNMGELCRIADYVGVLEGGRLVSFGENEEV